MHSRYSIWTPFPIRPFLRVATMQWLANDNNNNYKRAAQRETTQKSDNNVKMRHKGLMHHAAPERSLRTCMQETWRRKGTVLNVNVAWWRSTQQAIVIIILQVRCFNKNCVYCLWGCASKTACFRVPPQWQYSAPSSS